MTYFYPCFNCAVPKATCPKRAAVFAAVRGLGLTSIKFKCDMRKPRFERGQRVSFEWAVHGDYGDTSTYTFTGTVTHEKENYRRFGVKVDQNGQEIPPGDVFKGEFISVRPDDLKSLDEPRRSLCRDCAADGPEDVERLCWSVGELRYAPDHCLKRAAQKDPTP